MCVCVYLQAKYLGGRVCRQGNNDEFLDAVDLATERQDSDGPDATNQQQLPVRVCRGTRSILTHTHTHTHTHTQVTEEHQGIGILDTEVS